MKTQFNLAALAPSRSADFQSAVSRISNPQTTRTLGGDWQFNTLPTGSRRYSRLETCATVWRSVLLGWVLLLFTLNLQPSSLLAQGSLTPPGAPAPTMKTLQQVEPREPISSAPFIISQPGSYYLTTNLTVSGGDAITIATNGVTLDLNGFTISSTTNPPSGHAVLIDGGLQDITIQNGHIRGGVTNNGSGIFSGPGFGYGIYYSGFPQNVRVSGVSVSGCLYYGIYVGDGASTTVENCVVRTVGGRGIFASTIRGCVALDCGSSAIYGRQVSDSRGESVGSGTGLDALTAQNCFGFSSSGTGIYAYTAQNCYGSSSGGDGLYALFTAIGCYGSSSSGPRGLYAQNAAFCIGHRSGGTAIEAIIANGCWAEAGTNLITYKYNMP
jgi:hypothetical protein